MSQVHGSGSNVSFFLSGLAGGGAERSAIGLAAEMKRQGHQVELVVPNTKGPLHGLAVRELGLENLYELGSPTVRRSILALAKYLRTRKPKVLLVAPDDTVVFAALARLIGRVSGTRIVSIICNTISVRSRRMGIKGRFVNLALKATLPRVDLVVCKSQGSAKDLLENITSHINMVVIPNQVDFDEIMTLASKPVTHPWIDTNLPVVIGAGRLEPAKDFPELVRAFHLVRLEVPSAKLLILGEGRRRGEIEAVVSELGLSEHVELVGFVENPWAYIARSNVFVLSSVHEGFPRVVAEALACGTAVVATDCPSGPREILRDGELGKLVPVKDTSAMATAIIESLLRPLPTPPLEQSAIDYSPERVAQMYLNAIDDIHTRRGGRFLRVKRRPT